ncbi:hypothetical protein J2X65_003194 [Ancylobacter sp. 3268]|uniref:hypothetical protein n=1 Tax=Ancylobacter sp. 3268 TaxID=2817752 RepID=UPI00285FD84B|nr:hypothetical protein [Ancylobacter sp. 3268]MDR6953831.1 hypothetical protein [Ancylobacter sp. 3268]
MSPLAAFLAGASAALLTATPLAFWLGRRSVEQDDFPGDHDPYAEPHGEDVRLIGVGIGLAILTAAGVVAGVSIGFAHEAPSGWEYPRDCCSAYDCYPVPAGALRFGPGGITVEATGETFPSRSTIVRPSGDGAFHRCSRAGDPAKPTICLFVPGGV